MRAANHITAILKEGSLSSPKVNIVTAKSLDTEPFGPLSNREKKPTPAHRTTCLRYFERAKKIDSGISHTQERDRYIFDRAS